MPIRIIPNQPVQFGAAACNICDDSRNCLSFMNGDKLYVQAKQTPCGDDLICDGDFSSTVIVPAELLINGAFNANLDDWTAAGNWAWDSGKACSDGGSGDLSQNIALLPINTEVTIQMVVSNYIGGNLEVRFGATVLFTIIANGSYSTTYITGPAPVGIIITCDSDLFEGCIDNISAIYFVQDDDCWSNPPNWQIGPGQMCHLVGDTSPIENAIIGGVIDTNSYYQVYFKVKNRTTGSVAVTIGGSGIGQDADENKGYVQYIDVTTSDNTSLFTPTIDFDGCIYDVKLYKLSKGYRFFLKDTNNNIIKIITPTFKDDFITVAFDWNAEAIENGCDYSICYSDVCNGTQLYDETQIVPPGGQAFSLPTVLEDGTLYQIQIISDCDNVSLVFYGGVEIIMEQDPAGTFTGYFIAKTGTVNVTDFYTEPFEGEGCAGQLTITSFDSGCSQCLDYDIDDTITGIFYCYLPFYGYCDDNAFGFDFTTFQLFVRILAKIHSPVGDDEKTSYLLSSGVEKTIFAQREKYYTLQTEAYGEEIHDALDLIRNCDNFIIGAARFFAKESAYQPEWDKNGALSRALVRFSIKKEDGTVFNSNV